MNEGLERLAPQIVWSYFKEILTIPRPSGKEEKIRNWIVNWAKNNNFDYRIDAGGNLVVRVPPTKGFEHSPTVILQAHLDMVCEKDENKEFDFEKDPIEVWIDGEWLKTKGTTMGGDNGIGVALALAIATDRDVSHGPLELLFTVDEEVGLTGAFNLDPQLITGNYLLNLDSEEEGTFFVGCAGGGDTKLEFGFKREIFDKEGFKPYKFKLSGLTGGHSGLNIIENRANAIKFMARILREALNKFNIKVVSIEGGDKHNAIPRECNVILYLRSDECSKFKEFLNKWKEIFQIEYGKVDPNMFMELTPITDITLPHPIESQSLLTLIRLIMALPHGVLAMSREIRGLVESSNNVAVIRTEKDNVKIVTSSRSSLNSQLRMIRDSIYDIAVLAGCKVEESSGYPAWKPNIDSLLLKKASSVYKELFGKEPEVTAIHAGLECGVLGEKRPTMDMISFGPTLRDVHSPKERIHIPSVEKFYNFLKAVVYRLAVE